MRWGLITDTHNKFRLIDHALAIFVEQQCNHVFHCGDFDSNRALEKFLKQPFQFHYVTDHQGKHDRRLRKQYRKDYLTPTIARNRIALYHDTYRDCLRTVGKKSVEEFGVRRAVVSRQFDFVFYGHLHFLNLKLSSHHNPTIAVNAGGFYHKDLATFCILDLEAASLDVYHWGNGSFAAIVRFFLGKPLSEMAVLDQHGAHRFAKALSTLKWNSSDRCAHVFSDNEDECWFNLNLKGFFRKVGLVDKPEFFF